MRRRGLLPRPRLLRTLSKLAESLPTQGNALEVFHDGDLLYSRMLRDIRGATERVSLEMYMLLGDRTGWRFAHALAAKAKAGVPVRLVYDAVGSFGTAPRLFQLLRDSGVKVLEYHPVAPWRTRFALWGRNHRKNLIVDGRIGYTGGVNIGDLWAGRRRGGAAWRDTHARIEGPAAGDLEVLFEETWYRESGQLLSLTRTQPREPRRSDGSKPGTQIYVVGSRGGGKRRLRRLYQLTLGRGRRRACVTSSYFVPDRKLRRTFVAAGRRGVRVDLLLPDRTDVRVAQLASQALFSRLLQAGVSIHRYQPSILHAKTAVIDRCWSTIGTSNLDHLSLSANLESDLVIIDPTVGKGLEESFDRDLRRAREITFAEWQRRSWLVRVLEQLAYQLRFLL